MLLKRAHIQNFRSICNAEVFFGKQTAILGGNGVGKSSILKALERFYSSSTQVDIDDFFGRDARESIKIALTFIEFSAEERARFGSRIHADEMTVMRVFEAKGRSSGQYFGLTKRHEAFADIRAAESAADKKARYKSLCAGNQDLYRALPNLTKAGDIDEALEQWESRNIQHCQLMLDDGRFFGFTNVANGALQKSTSFVFVPAVRDASIDAVDGRGNSPIAKLMELVVRSAVQKREDIQNWQTRITAEYRKLTDPENLQELRELSGALTKTLRSLYAESAVNLTWRPARDFEVPLPTADVALEDGGFQSPVDRQGHGLQRAFIITLLQHLALAINKSQASDENEQSSAVLSNVHGVPEEPVPLPGLILAIEEPELYQHPSKQRHFASVLTKLTSGALPGVAVSTQIAFASHSPYFISVDRFDEVRIARRHLLQGMDCKQCRVTEAKLEEVVRRLESAFLEPEGSRNAAALRTRLHIFTADLAEGFFADLVVLVEGVSDRAAIQAEAIASGIDLEAMGIAVLVVEGKENMPNPAAIFKSLAIPVYLLWDCDFRVGTPEAIYNSVLQRITQESPRTAPTFGARNHTGETFSCFESNLESILRTELTPEVYLRHMNNAAAELGLAGRDHPQKAPAVMSEIIARSAAEGVRTPTLSAVVQAFSNLAIAARARP